MNDDAPLLLDVKDVAARLQVSVSMTKALIRRRVIRSVTIGRLRRVRSADLAEYVEGLGDDGEGGTS